MPFESQAQQGWAHTKEGTEALGGAAKVKEWDASTDFSKLPERKKPGPKPKTIKRLRHTTHPK